MGMSWVPKEVFQLSPGFKNALYNPIGIQFIHRLLGITLFILSIILVQKNRYYRPVFLCTTAQLLLGIATLVMHVPVTLGVLHQMGALILLSVLVYLR